MLRGMSYSENGIRTVILHIETGLWKSRCRISFWLYHRTLISTVHLCSEEIMLLLSTIHSLGKHLASTCYKQRTLLSMFLLEGAFPLISTSVGTSLWLNCKMPQEYSVKGFFLVLVLVFFLGGQQSKVD